MSALETNGPFYRESSRETGLRFVCTRCSACCRFDSGYVWLSRSDLLRLSRGLGLPPGEVVSRYCRVLDFTGITRVSLAEQENLDCIFWQNGSCQVYEHRPLQCRSYPFWAPYLGTRDEWNELESACPGVNVGPVHPPEEIDEWLAMRNREAPLDADTLREVVRNEG